MERIDKGIQLSIVVPVYKVEQYLEQCMDSIIAQNCSKLEVILVDDGSPDGSPEICDAYAEKYENINVIHKENGGSVSARKAGVHAAKGKYITFIDSDDWVEEGYCSRMIEIIEQYRPAVIAFTQHNKVESSGRIIQCRESERCGIFAREWLEKEVFPEILYKPPFYSCGVTPALGLKVIERDLLMKFIDQVPDAVAMGDDLCLSLPIMLYAHNVYFDSFCGYNYRMNANSITHSYDPKAAVRNNVLLKYMKSTIDSFDAFNLHAQLEMYAVWIASGTVASLVLGSSDIKKNLDEMGELLQNECVVSGVKKQIPIKSKILLMLARRKKAHLLMLLKCIFFLKKKIKNSFRVRHSDSYGQQ